MGVDQQPEPNWPQKATIFPVVPYVFSSGWVPGFSGFDGVGLKSKMFDIDS